jgi:Arc/MetJ-type ribon-helix-helix transcriptional regulator
MTFSREDGRPKLTVRVSSDLKQRVEEQPGTMSDVVRSAVRAYLPDEDRGLTPPEEDDLAEAYEHLLALSNGDGWVRERVATARLAQKHSFDQPSVRRHLLVPLSDRGYLTRRSNATGRFVSYRVNTNE